MRVSGSPGGVPRGRPGRQESSHRQRHVDLIMDNLSDEKKAKRMIIVKESQKAEKPGQYDSLYAGRDAITQPVGAAPAPADPRGAGGRGGFPSNWDGNYTE